MDAKFSRIYKWHSLYAKQFWSEQQETDGNKSGWEMLYCGNHGQKAWDCRITALDLLEKSESDEHGEQCNGCEGNLEFASSDVLFCGGIADIRDDLMLHILKGNYEKICLQVCLRAFGNMQGGG